MVIGGLVMAAVFVGGFAGWWSAGDAAAAESPQPAARAAPEPTEKVPSLAELWSAPAPRTKETPPVRPGRLASAEPKVRRAPDIPRPSVADAEPQDFQEELIQVDPVASEQASAEAAAPVATASLPLPDRTVARTIDRIGYACGRVSSTMAVEGEAPGVYKVTCTSGQSYQARPVNGRYHFRRWRKD